MMLARMKERSNYNVCSIKEIEYEVAEILCQLPQLVLRRYVLHLSWGSKKRRTSISPTTSPYSASPPPPPPPPRSTHHHPPPPVLLTYENGEEEEEEEEPISKVKKDTSPDTPLLFYSLSESDSKKKPHKRKFSKKKMKEEWEEDLMKISDQNDTFKKEVEKVKEHYKTLLAENLKIKSKRQELSNCRQREDLLDLNSSKRRTSLGLLDEQAGPTVPSPAPEQPLLIHQQPLLIYQKPIGSEIFENSQYMAQSFGPLGIPDLNFTVDHETTANTTTSSIATSRSRMGFFQPFDLRKAVITAEARRRRIEMTKVKKSMANAKTRLQIR